MTKATQSETQRIPKLRFPGFSGGWKLGKLGDVGEIIGGGTPDTTKNEYWNGEINWFTPTEIKSKYAKYSLRKITDIGFKNSSAKLLPVGTILFTSRATIGDVSIATVECSTNQGFQTIITNNQNSNEFIYYWLKKNRNEFLRKANGSTFLEVSSKEMKKMKNIFPFFLEQQKIAEFLRATDNLINNLKEQKENLESYKKGMMKKIFSQEIRFKDDKGKEFPKWEEKKLSEIGKSYNGLQGKSGEDFGEGEPYITYKQIFDSSELDVQKFALVKVASNEKQNKAQFGDVFFTVSSETPLEVGFASVLLNKEVSPYLNSFSFGFRVDSLREFDPYFLKFFFRTPIYRKEVVKLAQGSTRYNISKVEFTKMSFKFPAFLEQQKIADFLTSIDKVIESKQQQITEAEQWKKGLMQGLFV